MTMSIQTRLEEDLKSAMKGGDKERVSVFRFLLSNIKNRRIEKGKDATLSDDEITQVIMSSIKQRREAIEQFTKGGRSDLVEKEEAELRILQSYLPEQLSEEELTAKIQQVIAEAGAVGLKDMGKVMKGVMLLVSGRAEGSVVSAKVKSLLGG
jgi:uncharacterized protein